MTVTVPAARRNDFFLAFQETNIIDEKHAGELPGRIARDQERARLDMEERERRRCNPPGTPLRISTFFFARMPFDIMQQ